MSKIDEIRREQELAEAVRPQVLAALQNGEELLAISERLASENDVDARKAYKWISIMAEQFERRRRRVTLGGIVLLWAGVLAVLAGVLVSLFANPAFAAWLVGAAAGVPSAAAGIVVSTRAGRLVRDL